MSDRRQVAVLGLGRFGRALARELTRLGHEVLAVDTDERLVQAIADDVTHAVQADFTDEDALNELGLSEFDAVIVAVSSDLEVTVLATVMLQRVGVRRILARAASDLQRSILERLGVHRVVLLEHEMGVRIAQSSFFTESAG